MFQVLPSVIPRCQKPQDTWEFLPFAISAVAFLKGLSNLGIWCSWVPGVIVWHIPPRCNALVLGKFIKMTVHLCLFDPPKKIGSWMTPCDYWWKKGFITRSSKFKILPKKQLHFFHSPTTTNSIWGKSHPFLMESRNFPGISYKPRHKPWSASTSSTSKAWNSFKLSATSVCLGSNPHESNEK